MQGGRHDWPEEFRDEDIWLFLTKRQWLIMLIGLLFGGAVVGIFILLHLTVLISFAFIIAGLILIAAAVVAFITMPDRYYLFGGGEKLEKILFRLFKKSLKNSKVIWTANYENGCEDWGKGAERVKEAKKRRRNENADLRSKLPWE